jgi:stage III sporulation protein AA
MKDSVFDVLPEDIRRCIRRYMGRMKITDEDMLELRMRINKPVYMTYMTDKNKIKECSPEEEKGYIVTRRDIDEVVDRITDYSPYAFENEIRQGFITIKGGHRVGMAGQTVLSDGKVTNLKNISFINIRFAHQKKGCGEYVMPYIVNGGEIRDTLIISPPGCGKTTLLRDIIRMISTETDEGLNVAVVDERSEIAGCYMGEPQLNVGIRTDVLDACPKVEGMMMLIRSMNPDVIAVDEIGSREDIDAIHYVSNCGCSILATVHGASVDDIRTRPVLRRLVEERRFERYIVLSRRLGVGTVESIFDERGNPVDGFSFPVGRKCDGDGWLSGFRDKAWREYAKKNMRTS